MRSLYYGDISCAARVLLGVPQEERWALCQMLIAETDTADRFFRRSGKLHPVYGNGTLRAAALRRQPGAEPTFDSADYRACFIEVLGQLDQRGEG